MQVTDLLCVLPLAAISGILVELGHYPESFSWYQFDLLDGPFDPEGQFLGHVVDRRADTFAPRLQVVLENGDKVITGTTPRFIQSPASDYVVIRRYEGRYSNVYCDDLEYYMRPEDLDLLTERRLSELK